MYKTLDGFVATPKHEIQANCETANPINLLDNELPILSSKNIGQSTDQNFNTIPVTKTPILNSNRPSITDSINQISDNVPDVFNIDYSDYDYSNIKQIKSDLFVKPSESGEYSSQIQITTQADLFDQASIFSNSREQSREFAQISRYKKTWYQKLNDLTKVKIYEGNFVLYRPFPVVIWNTMKNLSRNNSIIWAIFGLLFILTISFQIKLAKASPIINYIPAEKSIKDNQ